MSSQLMYNPEKDQWKSEDLSNKMSRTSITVVLWTPFTICWKFHILEYYYLLPAWVIKCWTVNYPRNLNVPPFQNRWHKLGGGYCTGKANICSTGAFIFVLSMRRGQLTHVRGHLSSSARKQMDGSSLDEHTHTHAPLDISRRSWLTVRRGVTTNVQDHFWMKMAVHIIIICWCWHDLAQLGRSCSFKVLGVPTDRWATAPPIW